MRIAYVVDYFQPQIGYQVTYLSRIHQAMGHQVAVVTSDRYVPFPDFKHNIGTILGDRVVGASVFQEDRLLVYRLPCVLEYGSNLMLMRGLWQTLRSFQPDIVSVDNVFALTAFEIAYRNRFVGWPLVYDTHASTFNTKITGTLTKDLKRFVFRRWMMPVIRQQADAIVAIGESEKWLVCQEFGLDSTAVPIIPLGADHEMFQFDAEARYQARQSLGLTDNDVVIVHAGKLTPSKDVHVLLEAAAPLLQTRPACKLLIIGAGNPVYMQDLRDMARDNNVTRQVVFHEFVLTKTLVDLYSASDIGVWPGNLSNTILEAMSVGLPVVLPAEVSQHQTTRHLLSNVNGFAFDRGNVKELRHNLELLLSDSDMRAQMGIRSRELIVRELNWKSIAKQFLEVYAWAIENRHRSQ